MKDEEIVVSARDGWFQRLACMPGACQEVAIWFPARAQVEPADVDEVIMGQVLTAPRAEPARQVAIAAGIPIEATAWALNQVCGRPPALPLALSNCDR